MPICIPVLQMGNPELREVRSLAQAHPPSLKEPSSFGCQYWACTRRSIHVLVQEGSFGAGFEPVLSCLWMGTWSEHMQSPQLPILLHWVLTAADWINLLGTQRCEGKGARARCGGRHPAPGVFPGQVGI